MVYKFNGNFCRKLHKTIAQGPYRFLMIYPIKNSNGYVSYDSCYTFSNCFSVQEFPIGL